MQAQEILIGEDDVVLAGDLQLTLTRLGYVIGRVVSTGEEAIKEVEKARPDLVLMEVVLPGEMDGIEAARHIRRQFGIPVVYLAADSDEASVDRAMVTEPYGYLLKPVRRGDLRATIEIALHRHQMEKFLRESEERYRSLVETQGELICRYLPNGTITFANQAYCRYFSKTVGDLIGQQHALVVPDEDRESVVRHFALLTPDNPVSSHEHRVIGPDGNIRWQQWTDRIILDAQGNLVEIQGVGRDITERKRAEAEVVKAKEEWENTFNAVPDLIAIMDNQPRIVRANKAMMERLGSVRGNLVGPFCHIADHETERPWAGCPHAHALLNCTEGPAEVVEENLGGVFSITCTPLKNAEGRVEASVHVARDITRQKSAEEALRRARDELEMRVRERTRELRDLTEQFQQEIEERKRTVAALRGMEERLRRLIEASPIGITIVRDGRYTFVNPAFAGIFGYDDPDQIVGLSVKDLHFPEETELMKPQSRESEAGNEVSSHREIKALRKNGESFDAAMWMTPIDFECELASLVFLADISEAKNLRSQLLQAQKMEAIGTLAGGIAHDFNNVLTVVLGLSDLLLMGTNEQDPSYADLVRINQTARNGAELVQRILAFSRKTKIDLRPVNLNQVIGHVKKLLTRTIPKMIEIRLVLSPKAAAVNADPAQVEQILMNLATNATDAMPEGGTLTVETRNVTMDEQFCKLNLGSRPGDYVLLLVSDTGQGMNCQTVKQVFEPFFTTKEIGRGTGLGLSMVYGIVKQHGGYITCHSELGAGTEFRIYLPAIPTQEKLRTTKEESAIPLGTETILLVDDEEGIRDMGKRLLSQFGYTVLCAANGTEALAVFREAEHKISLVILDLIMPEMGGKQCLAELMVIDPHAKVLMASGYCINQEIQETIQMGARGFVGKPFTVRQMLGAVREILDRA